MLKPFSDYTNRSNYLGDTHDDFLIALVGDDKIFEANEEELLKRFEKINLVEDTDFIRTSLGNFCGPSTKFLLVHKDCVLGVDVAENAQIEIKNYPVLDDEIYSRLETEETEGRWNNNYDDDERRSLSMEYLGEELTEWDDIVAHTNFSQLQDWIMLD